MSSHKGKHYNNISYGTSTGKYIIKNILIYFRNVSNSMKIYTKVYTCMAMHYLNFGQQQNKTK